MLRCLARTVVALLITASPLLAATPTFDQLLSMRSAGSPRISPDGRLVAFTVTETDWKENGYVTQLWVAEVQSGRTYQLTRGKKSADGPQWSPDGRWLAFMTERESGAIVPTAEKDKEGKTEEKKDVGKEEPKKAAKDEKPSDAKPSPRQIWLISPQGGEAWQLTRHGAAINGYRWSEDGTRIAFTAAVPESKAARERKEKYSDFEVFEEDFEQSQLWVVDVGAAEKGGLPADAKQVTSDARVNVRDISWSPDGRLIAFTGTTSPLLSFGGSADIYVADLSRDNAVKKVVALEGPDGGAEFSPDGTRLAFNTSLAVENFFYANDHIATVLLADVMKAPATKPGDVNDLTASFDEDAGLLRWAPAGIYFRAQQRTTSHLFRLDPERRSIVRVTQPDEFYLGDVSFTRAYDRIAFSSADRTRVTEISTAPLPAAGGPLAPKRLTDLQAQYAGFKLGTAEVISWKSTDGAAIEGVLHKPADYDASRKYPLLVVIHGGPTGVSRPVLNPVNRYYPIEAFLAKGALVLEPNYRGSAGYGADFRALNVRNLGVGDMWDVMSGVDALIARGMADPSRLGSMGWSQGGYISAFLTTNTDRFKAISVGAGISNWMTYYVNTDITPFTRQYLKATPWDDPKVYAETSPMTNIRKAKTPTLIQHGERDKRVPPPNAFELYRGLRDMGVPAKLIVYAGFGHGINKPKSNRAVLQHNYDWFSHYVFGEPLPKESPLHGSGSSAP